MNANSHSRAKLLILESRAGTIEQPERIWLEDHLRECTACSAHATSMDRTVQSLRLVPIRLDPSVVAATRVSVRARADQLGSRRIPRVWLWLTCALSWAWIAETCMLLWRGFAWLGSRFGVPSPLWQMAFALWWAVPALVAAMALSYRSLQGADSLSNP